MQFVIILITITVNVGADLYQECAKLNYLAYFPHLPSAKLPYFGDVPIPLSPAAIAPTSVIKTKAISVVTKYVYKNPVCVKYTKKRGMCEKENSVRHKGSFDQLVTKEYFVKDKRDDVLVNSGRGQKKIDYDDGEDDNRYQLFSSSETKNLNDLNTYLKSSEDSRPFWPGNQETPNLVKQQIHEMLIEDRLDQLETILPHYTRRRTYETSTITVTKVLSNRRTMATLLVNNCMPYGFDVCPPKNKKRKSRVALETNTTIERDFFG